MFCIEWHEEQRGTPMNQRKPASDKKCSAQETSTTKLLLSKYLPSSIEISALRYYIPWDAKVQVSEDMSSEIAVSICRRLRSLWAYSIWITILIIAALIFMTVYRIKDVSASRHLRRTDRTWDARKITFQENVDAVWYIAELRINGFAWWHLLLDKVIRFKLARYWR